jgi:hypothetical protein
MNEPPLRIAVVIPGDPSAPPPAPAETRFHRVFEELTALGAAAEPVVYGDAVADAVRTRLLEADGVLVWINPLYEGHDRTILDGLLREVAAAGVFVSAHPEVILAMGTKDVLYRTRDLPFGTDTRLYRTWDELARELPSVLREQGPRVLKQHRGNDGDGVWRVEPADANAPPDLHSPVRVQHALRGAHLEEMPLAAFLERCRPYFAGTGCVIDQQYQPRLAEGMIRAYLVHDRVAGFGHQLVTALLPPRPGEAGPPDPPPRVYFGPARPEFQRLRALLEGSWVRMLQDTLGITREALPVIWDADFLLGPRDAEGNDGYVLCEINMSSVFPIPDESFAPLAAAAIERAREQRARRS